jgi:phenylacetate-coenzyme A ligase PaaK-like adenylate-forming protein
VQSLNSLKTDVFQVDDHNFEQHALDTFAFQYSNNNIYREYVLQLGISQPEVKCLSDIPYLPIQFFKHHRVVSGVFDVPSVFHSSGTKGSTSKHYMEDLGFYKKVSTKIFQDFFGELKNSVVIGLLPSYLERGNSSLVFMVNHFIKISENPNSGFYLDNMQELVQRLHALSGAETTVHLFGVTFALQELASHHQLSLKHINIFETGGMKGRGKELIREELHQKLRSAFQTEHVFSEYGMTELLSQAYLKKEGLFHTPPWMRVSIRELYDPFVEAPKGKAGVIRVIDLANAHSCSFIETEDLGASYNDGFTVLGRMDNAELRGCNLLLS